MIGSTHFQKSTADVNKFMGRIFFFKESENEENVCKRTHLHRTHLAKLQNLSCENDKRWARVDRHEFINIIFFFFILCRHYAVISLAANNNNRKTSKANYATIGKWLVIFSFVFCQQNQCFLYLSFEFIIWKVVLM